jgi:hypothetical protein
MEGIGVLPRFMRNFVLVAARPPQRNRAVRIGTAWIYFSAIPAAGWQVFFDFDDVPEQTYLDDCRTSVAKRYVIKVCDG